MLLCQYCDGILLIGTSCTTYSTYKLICAAKENNSKIGIVNVGTTRADAIADFKVWNLIVSNYSGNVIGWRCRWRSDGESV